MAVLTPNIESSLLQRADTKIRATLTSFEPTPWVYELMPTGTQSIANTMYGIGLLECRPQDERQKQSHASRSRDLNAVAEVGIRLMSRLRTNRQTDDYKTHLVNEALIRAVLVGEASSNSDSLGPQTWRWDRSLPRQAVGDGTYIMGELRFTVWYRPSTSL